ncbi:MAG: metal ABC transporter permease [Armatimonadota bacterium]|nr:MAG: metal ABC transporter permease [Armatimonadota bacterium]
MQHAVLATFLAGIACPLVGVLVVIMRLSFIGVCMSHAAFAGALLGLVLGVHPLLVAFLFALAAAGVLGPLADRGDFAPDTAMGIVFSSSLGLSFLLLALIPGPKTEALNLLWGSPLTVIPSDLIILAVVAAAAVLLSGLFFKEIQAVVFHRELAAAVGIPATAVYYGLLLLSGTAITASLKAIGGLLVFALIINPAAAAYQLTYSLRRMFLLAVGFGVLSGWAGLALSSLLNLPSGAFIIVVSSLVFVAAALLSPKRRIKRARAAEATQQ